MANQFEFLTRAKPASVHKLLQKLPLEEAAIVLTGLPQTTVVQVMAYFPDEMQATLLPAMRAARQLPPETREATAGKIKNIIRTAKSAQQAVAAPSQAAAPSAPAEARAEPPSRPIPITPPVTPPAKAAQRPPARPAASNRLSAPGANPYQSAPPPKAPPGEAAPSEPAAPSPLGALGSKLKDALKTGLQSLNTPKPEKPEKAAGEPPPRRTSSIPPPPRRREPPAKPVPWVPRTATSSPINGPALPGSPPAVAGDPYESPLAQAGLLDLIGRAQEKFLPKTPPRKAPPPPAARRPLPGRPQKRPEPREGMALPGEVQVGSTPRVIGPRAPGAPVPEKGARRMDGKAILAAILREAGPEIRSQVQGGDPQLFKQLRDRMFYFDDLIYTEDNSLARVFTTAPAETAALALKFAAPALRDRVMRVVSPGRAKALTETPQRSGLDEIEAAQKKVLGVALQLQAAGRILIDPCDPDLAGM